MHMHIKRYTYIYSVELEFNKHAQLWNRKFTLYPMQHITKNPTDASTTALKKKKTRSNTQF